MSRLVSQSGQELEVEQRGEGDVNVLLAHGLTAVRRHVLMGSKALERNERFVVGYDARGHGESAPASDSLAYEYRDLKDDALAVMDSTGVDRAIVVGVSMGAHTAALLAIENPARVAGLVLVTPAYDPELKSGPTVNRFDALADGLEQGGVEGFIEAFGDGGVSQRWAPVVKRAVIQRMALHRHPAALADAMRVVARSRPFESFDQLGAIKVPALVIASRDEADPGHPLACAQRWADALNECPLLVEEPEGSPLAWSGRAISEAVEAVISRAASSRLPRDLR